MNLESDRQRNVQGQLDFSSSPAGEAREAGREGTESLPAVHGPESPASTNRLMEEVCERENLKEALRRGKEKKGRPGGHWMTRREKNCFLEKNPTTLHAPTPTQ